MSEIEDKIREARIAVNDVATIAPDQEIEDKLGNASELLGDALADVAKLEGELVRLEAGGEPSGEITLAKTIRVVRDGGRGMSLEIDGAEFPWYVHEEGVSIGHIRRDDVPRVVVPIIAERVEVIDSIDTAPTLRRRAPVLDEAGTAARLEQPEPERVRNTTAPERQELEEEPGIVRPGRDR